MWVYGLSVHNYSLNICHKNKYYTWAFTSKTDASQISKKIKIESLITIHPEDKVIKMPVSFLMKKPPPPIDKNTKFDIYPNANIYISIPDISPGLQSIDIDEIDYDYFLTCPIYNIPTALSYRIAKESNDEIVVHSTIFEAIEQTDIV